MLFLGLLTTFACLPKFWESQCINDGKCTHIKVQSEGRPSEHPFEMSRDDTSFDVKLGDFQLTDRGLTAKTFTRETCRALHLAERTYVVVQKEWYHKPFKGYSKVDDFYVNGDYLPCSDWVDEDTIQVAPKLTKQPSSNPLVSINGQVEMPSTLLGIGMLENPTLPALRLAVVDNQRSIEFVTNLPERNATWLCDTIPNIQQISAVGHYSDWTISVMHEDRAIQVPYIFEDAPRLLQLSDAIAQCDSKARNYLGGIIAASAKANPESYAHLNYMYTELFGLKLKKPRRTGSPKSSSGTTKTTSSTTESSSRSIVGTYQCKQGGQMAYLRIYRNGVFNLKLELENGSAQGVCSDSSCTIDSISNGAVNFTGGVNKFTVRRSGDSLLINGNVRCAKRS